MARSEDRRHGNTGIEHSTHTRLGQRNAQRRANLLCSAAQRAWRVNMASSGSSQQWVMTATHPQQEPDHPACVEPHRQAEALADGLRHNLACGAAESARANERSAPCSEEVAPKMRTMVTEIKMAPTGLVSWSRNRGSVWRSDAQQGPGVSTHVRRSDDLACARPHLHGGRIHQQQRHQRQLSGRHHRHQHRQLPHAAAQSQPRQPTPPVHSNH